MTAGESSKKKMEQTLGTKTGIPSGGGRSTLIIEVALTAIFSVLPERLGSPL